jgi:hypothetical protein
MMIGIGITTIGILLLVLGLVGGSIEASLRLVPQLVQQQLSQALEQLPGILRQDIPLPAAGESGGRVDSADVLTSLIGSVISNPLWLILIVVGVGLIYLSLYMTQRQRPGGRQL